MTLRIVRRALYLDVAEQLREMIFSGTLGPGEWVDEQRIAESFGISRTPLREAIRMLVAEGLLRLEPRRGCFVNQLEDCDLDEIFPLMAMLEGRCGYEATLRLRDEDLAGLEDLHARLAYHAGRGEVDAYYETNRAIHAALQTLAGNRWLSDAIDVLRRVIGLYRHKSLTLPGRIKESCAEHLAIFAALKARDPQRVDALTQAHLLRQLDALKSLARSTDTPVEDVQKEKPKRKTIA